MFILQKSTIVLRDFYNGFVMENHIKTVDNQYILKYTIEAETKDFCKFKCSMFTVDKKLIKEHQHRFKISRREDGKTTKLISENEGQDDLHLIYLPGIYESTSFHRFIFFMQRYVETFIPNCLLKEFIMILRCSIADKMVDEYNPKTDNFSLDAMVYFPETIESTKNYNKAGYSFGFVKLKNHINSKEIHYQYIFSKLNFLVSLSADRNDYHISNHELFQQTSLNDNNKFTLSDVMTVAREKENYDFSHELREILRII